MFVLPDFFHYDFMLRALAAGILVAVIAPVIGLFLAVRRYSYLADTLAHVSLVGVAAGLIANINPVASALGVSVIAGWAMERIRRSGRFFGESILAVFLSGSLAIALLLIGAAHKVNQDLLSYLFGSITTVRTGDVWVIAGTGLVVLLGLAMLYRPLFLTALHEDIAAAEGLPVARLNVALVVAAALTVGLSMRIVGVLLIGALMIIPVMAALQLGKSFKTTLVFAIILSVAATFFGLIISFYANVPSGATIVVCTLLGLVASLVYTKGKG